MLCNHYRRLAVGGLFGATIVVIAVAFWNSTYIYSEPHSPVAVNIMPLPSLGNWTDEVIAGLDVRYSRTGSQKSTEAAGPTRPRILQGWQETASTTHSMEVSLITTTHKPTTPQQKLPHMHNISSKLAMNLVVVNFMGYNSKTSEQLILDRELEYMTVLQRNLGHIFVARVHILTTDSNATKERLLDFDLPNRHKLVVAQVARANSMRNVFDYISQNLVGQDVMYLNGDIYLADGFGRINAHVMRQRYIIYGLTRRGKQETKCKMVDYCRPKRSIGSHDAFLFHLSKSISENALKNLEYPLGSWGSENVLLWMFKYRLKYCVLNPCWILKTYHLHCSKLRTGGKIRVNLKKSYFAKFTNRLVC